MGKLKDIIQNELWHTTGDDIASRTKRILLAVLETIVLSARGFTDKDLNIKANGLTYSLMFAIVPIMAMVLAVAKGFGFEGVIEQHINASFLGQMNLAPTVMGFVQRYLDTTQGGAFIGIGLLILLGAVYLFFRLVERSFNGIWNVKQSRSLGRQLTNYIFILFLIPLLIIVTSGLSIFLNTAAAQLPHVAMLRNMQTWLVKFLSFVVSWAIFTWMYKAIPNTNVKLYCALIPGIIIGTLFQVLQMLSVYIIVFLARTSVIYGAFASLPLIMMWLQWSCILMLLGATMSFSIQNRENYAYETELNTMSRRYKDSVMIYLLKVVIDRFERDEQPMSAHGLALQEHLPTRMVTQLLSRLVEIGLLREVYVEGVQEKTFQPAMDTHSITLGMVYDRIDCQGAEMFLKNATKPMCAFWDKFVAIRKTHNNSDSTYIRDL